MPRRSAPRVCECWSAWWSPSSLDMPRRSRARVVGSERITITVGERRGERQTGRAGKDGSQLLGAPELCERYRELDQPPRGKTLPLWERLDCFAPNVGISHSNGSINPQVFQQHAEHHESLLVVVEQLAADHFDLFGA